MKSSLNSKPIPIQRANELFYYSQGSLFYKSAPSRRFRIGDKAGGLSDTGYVRVGIDGKKYPAHRVIWAICNQLDPGPYEVDHIDRDKLNNSIENLRLATRKQNQANRSIKTSTQCVLSGISWSSSKNGWRVRVRLDGKRREFGQRNLFCSAVKLKRQAMKESVGVGG